MRPALDEAVAILEAIAAEQTGPQGQAWRGRRSRDLEEDVEPLSALKDSDHHLVPRPARRIARPLLQLEEGGDGINGAVAQVWRHLAVTPPAVAVIDELDDVAALRVVADADVAVAIRLHIAYLEMVRTWPPIDHGDLGLHSGMVLLAEPFGNADWPDLETAAQAVRLLPFDLELQASGLGAANPQRVVVDAPCV
jgi:hypothetical protein